MQNRLFGIGRITAVAAGFAIALWASPLLAADPSAAGLWQKLEDGKPVVWVLVLDRRCPAKIRTKSAPSAPTTGKISRCSASRSFAT